MLKLVQTIAVPDPHPGSCRLATRSLRDEEIRAIANSVYRNDNPMRFESVRYSALMFEGAGYAITPAGEGRVTRVPAAVAVGKLMLDSTQRIAVYDGCEIALKMREFDLLEILAHHPGQVFKRSQLLEIVWPRDFEGDERTVDVHIGRIRHKLREPQPPQLILTVQGVGYKLALPKSP
jgi:DNA-binding response OmpR family regulator